MNHTLVIPTYNRPELVRRLLAYYRRRATAVEFLVLDSSRAEIAADNARWFADHHPDVRHVVYPDTTPPAAKLAKGLAHVRTPYVSFCADDDVVFPQGLADAVHFLEGHPEYVCAHGLYLNFQVHPGSRDVNLWCEYSGPGNEAGHCGARIFRLFQNYESLYYAAFRSHELREIFTIVADIPSLHFQELFQSVAALIKGKVRRFAHLYAARQSCTPAEPDRTNWQTYYWFADNPGELIAHYQRYSDALWGYYEVHAAAPRHDRAVFQRMLDLAHAVYFGKGCPPPYFYSRLQEYWPTDTYGEPGEVDLFDHLGDDPAAQTIALPAARQKSNWTGVSLAELLRHATQAVLAIPYRFSLDWRVGHLGNTPWKVILPWKSQSLAMNAEFRRTYLELCMYLDAN